MKSDGSLNTKEIEEMLAEITGVYVDDLLQADSPEFKSFYKKTRKLSMHHRVRIRSPVFFHDVYCYTGQLADIGRYGQTHRWIAHEK